MSWYSIELGECLAASGPTAQIEGAWNAMTQAAAKAGAKTDYSCAVFRRGDLGAKQITMYITPAAEVIARVFGAVKCERPLPLGIRLFLGDARAWSIHFPGEHETPGPGKIWQY